MLQYQIKIRDKLPNSKPHILTPHLNIIRRRGVSDVAYWQKRIEELLPDCHAACNAGTGEEMRLAVGIFFKPDGAELQAAYHRNNKAIIVAINKETLPLLWSGLKRKISDSISDAFCNLAMSRVDKLAMGMAQ